jgi:hypothetical protein
VQAQGALLLHDPPADQEHPSAVQPGVELPEGLREEHRLEHGVLVLEADEHHRLPAAGEHLLAGDQQPRQGHPVTPVRGERARIDQRRQAAGQAADAASEQAQGMP